MPFSSLLIGAGGALGASLIDRFTGGRGGGGSGPTPSWGNPYAGIDPYPEAQSIANEHGVLRPGFEVNPEFNTVNPYYSRPDSITQEFANQITGKNPVLFDRANRLLRGSFLRGQGDAAEQAYGAGARAQSQLAAHGGIGRGARERLQERIGEQAMLGQNALRGSYLDAQQKMADSEASRRHSGMISLAGLDEQGFQFNAQQRARAQEFNVLNRLRQSEMDRQHALDKYKFDTGVLASGRLADRQEQLAERQRQFTQSQRSSK